MPSHEPNDEREIEPLGGVAFVGRITEEDLHIPEGWRCGGIMQRQPVCVDVNKAEPATPDSGVLTKRTASGTLSETEPSAHSSDRIVYGPPHHVDRDPEPSQGP
jgi:hypothetical protein